MTTGRVDRPCLTWALLCHAAARRVPRQSKIVTQVKMAVLYRGGGGAPGRPGSVKPGLESGQVLPANRADHIRLGALQSGGVLIGVEPSPQMLAGSNR